MEACEKNALWSCAVRSTGTFERGVRLQHRGTHRSEALQRCHVLPVLPMPKLRNPTFFTKNASLSELDRILGV